MRIVIRRKTKEDDFFLASLYIYTLLTFVPYFKTLPVIYVQMPIMVLCFLSLLLSAVNKRGRKFAGSVFACAVIIVILNFVFIYLQSDYSGTTLTNRIGANYSLFVTSFPILLVFSGGFERIDRERLRNPLLFIVLLICVTTIIGTFRYYAPCRQLATPNNPELNRMYLQEGIGGYGFIYFLVLCAPIVLREIRKEFSVFKLLVLIAMVYCVIRSEYTTAIILMVFSLVVSFLMQRGSFLAASITVVVGIVVLIKSEDIIRWALRIFDGVSIPIEVRLRSMLQYYQYETMTGDLLARRNLYARSINSFISNPLVGGFFKTGSQVGGHSEILDLIGHSGLFGVTALILVIRWVRRRTSIGFLNIDVFFKTMFFVAFVLALINTFSAPELFYAVLVIPALFAARRESVKEYGSGNGKEM